MDGEWNGRMTGVWRGGKPETFLDVTQLPAMKKIVKPVAEQEKYESRYTIHKCYLIFYINAQFN